MLRSEQLEERDLFAVWTPLTNVAPDAIGTMMLLTDGTVMAQGGGVSKDWYKLTPDNTGNYHNGTWSKLASMSLERLYFGSNVLPDGRVFVLGGEYSGPAGNSTWVNSGEMYDSLTNTWTATASFPKSSFGDGQTNLLTNGLILAGDLSSTQTYLYDPSKNTWSRTGDKLHGDNSNEETWGMLPDGSIITADVFVNNRSQRYVPETGKWVDAGTVPVVLTGPAYGYEMGPGTMLPDGRYFQAGANDQSAIYDPKTNSWTAGPALPNGLGADDSPGAMLTNGHFIYAVDTPLFNGPTHLLDYNPTTNRWTDVTPSQLSAQLNQSAYLSRMLILPNGNMLMTTSDNQLWEYTPDGAPDPTWAPIVTDISHAGNVYTVKGMQLNGLWEGATYGEDAEMSTNYPIAKITDANGVVSYARTLNWSAAVATGSKIVSTDFVLPGNIGPGPYKLNIIANGIASRTINNIDDALLIALDPVASYTEDNPATVLSPNGTVSTSVTNFNQSTLTVQIQANADTGDTLGIANTGNITVTGVNVFEGATPVAQITSSKGTSEVITFNSNATLTTVQNVIRAVSFKSTSQSPSTLDRTVLFILDNNSNGSVGSGVMNITVSATNDAPFAQLAMLPAVLEDAVFVGGTSIATLTSTSVFDPDANATVSGIVLTDNSTPAAEGKWQYSVSNSGVWQDVPAVSSNAGLVLPRQGRLRFLPGTDFNGPATPLRYRALDDTYAGTFTTQLAQVFLDVSVTSQTGPISQSDGSIGIDVTPVNDPPIALQPSIEISVLQGQPIDQALSQNLFFDIDSTLSYSFGDISGALTNWLHVDAQTLFISGVPQNQNVGTLYLQLTASDGENTASIPVTITVVNVNDPPEQLRMTGGSVPENKFGAQIGALFGIDPDGDPFNWTSSDSRFFVRDGQIILNTPLDFENQADRQIPVTFTAVDTGLPSLSTSLDVVINTLDVNEAFPKLQPKIYRINHLTPTGTVIDNLVAPDADTAQTVKFRFRSGDTSNFTLNETTGELRLANANLTPNTTLHLFVDAYDNGSPSFSTTAQMLINVVPANFSAPVIAANQSFVFQENLAAGTRIGQVKATDADGNPLLFDSITIDGGAADWLRIDSSTGDVFVTANHRFDFETQRQLTATVTLHENLDGGNTVTGQVALSLLNVNDAPSGLGDLVVYTNRFGTPVTSGFQVIDQDPSISGYTFATSDSRFEIRQGKLALKPDQFISPTLAGQELIVPILVTDAGDLTSHSLINQVVHVVLQPAWQNPLNHLDINRDGLVTASDANGIISKLIGTQQFQALTIPRPFSTLNDNDFDVNGNNSVTPSDVVEVINFLNARSAGPEGEATVALANKPVDKTWEVALQAVVVDLDDQLRRRK
ncbi:MAG: cadherin domain-containing protein [Pirellulales bacterium]